MKTGFTLVAIVAATPAAAHQEVVVVASFLPLAAGLVTITLASLAAWRRRFKAGRVPFSDKPKTSDVKTAKLTDP